MRRFLHRCLTRTPVLGLLMAALVFRALIPAGFMPTQDENGRMVMELCSGFTTKSVIIDLGEHKAGSELFERSHCGFTAAALPLLTSAAVSFPVSLALHEQVDVAIVPVAIAPLPWRAQSPRGPPLV